MADKKKKVRSVKDTPRHKVGVVLGTGFFVILCAIIVFPVFAGPVSYTHLTLPTTPYV